MLAVKPQAACHGQMQTDCQTGTCGACRPASSSTKQVLARPPARRAQHESLLEGSLTSKLKLSVMMSVLPTPLPLAVLPHPCICMRCDRKSNHAPTAAPSDAAAAVKLQQTGLSRLCRACHKAQTQLRMYRTAQHHDSYSRDHPPPHTHTAARGGPCTCGPPSHG